MKFCRFSFSKYNSLRHPENVKLYSSDVSIKSKSNKSSLKKYSSTLLLPKTTFPLKSNLKFEEEIQKWSSVCELYSRQRLKQSDHEFIIHDGPPYANGDLHLGHAVNKIAKDITCRYKLKKEVKIEFIPGWDCHGLPIESKSLSNSNESNDPISIRRRAFTFARSTIDKQRETFKRWGLMADWNNPYFTYDKDYICNQIEVFAELYEKGLIYKAFRPVYWSPSNKTTLAEAELDYNPNHDGYSVFVKFAIRNLPQDLFNKNVSAVIWTTTPWTLVSNQAIAYNKNKEYSIVRCKGPSDEYFLLASETVDRMCHDLKMPLEIVKRFDASLLKDLMYQSLANDAKLLPFIESDFVTMSKGSGLVHCAPNHGYEDYCVAIKHCIDLDQCVVDKEGKFKKEAGPLLEGKDVLNEGSESVLELYKNNIIARSKYVHNYPYDWRSKKPLITLPTSQWFLDSSQIREKCIEALENVEFIPSGMKQDLIHHLNTKPPWCLSRQRSWGVAIPAFYKVSDELKEFPIFSRSIVNHVSEMVNKHGIDAWWILPTSQLFPKELREKLKCYDEVDRFEKETDIFDVWFDSGISWKNVLKGSKVADMYLEGSDQVRGWFQSSLVLSVALRGKSPYKSVCVHGFVVDKNGRKMSKSEGNVVDPKDVVEGKHAVGADVLRWWVARNFSSSPMLFHINETFKEQVDKIRNTLRFCVASLNDFDLSKSVEYSQMCLLDLYVLHILFNYSKELEESYSKIDLKQISRSSISTVNHISAFYFSAIKDRLYCDIVDSKRRRSCQTVLSYIYQVLLQNISPILPHLSEELFQHQSQSSPNPESFFEQPWFACSETWNQAEIFEVVSKISQINDELQKNFASQQTDNLDLFIQCEDHSFLEKLRDLQRDSFSLDSELTQMLRVSTVAYGKEFSPTNNVVQNFVVNFLNTATTANVYVKHSEFSICHRCRRYTVDNNEQLCSRCLHVLSVQYAT